MRLSNQDDAIKIETLKLNQRNQHYLTVNLKLDESSLRSKYNSYLMLKCQLDYRNYGYICQKLVKICQQSLLLSLCKREPNLGLRS
jgi:hypothetical protein